MHGEKEYKYVARRSNNKFFNHKALYKPSERKYWKFIGIIEFNHWKHIEAMKMYKNAKIKAYIA